jgi:1-acyl-sn-glycerol-3-phosphate acyltransferase
LKQFFGSLSFAVFYPVFTIVYASAVIVVAPLLSLKNRWLMCMGWIAGIVQALKLLCRVRWTVQGREHLPSTGGFIIVAKHQSTWETFGIPVILFPRRICFVYKRELNFIPFFGWSMALLRMVPIDRRKGSLALEQVQKVGTERLRAGACMIFFPEGTRVPPGQKKRYKLGGAHLAVASGFPVIPVAHNAGECWPKGAFLKRPGTIDVRIGPALDPAGHTAESLMNAAESWIESQMTQIDQTARTDAATIPH